MRPLLAEVQSRRWCGAVLSDERMLPVLAKRPDAQADLIPQWMLVPTA